MVTISDSNQWNHRICVCIESKCHWVFIAHPGLALIDMHAEEISQSLSESEEEVVLLVRN